MWSMNKFKKWSIIILVSVVCIFSYFWTEGFGIKPKYSYGDTIPDVLNFWYDRDLSYEGFKKEVFKEKLDNNRVLIVYETSKNNYGISILYKKWNGKWVEVGNNGIREFSEVSSTGDDIEFQWSNFKEYGVTLGQVYNENIKHIKQNGVDAKIFNVSSNKRGFYVINKGDFGTGDLKFITNIKGYDANNKVV
ncbi:hypothetical protein, partial [Clostridium sp.]|uniref:hypothetical protein n=1 Tax=Clostridium sp. TaxID=1506 RepID=UPI002FC9C822